MNVKPDSQPIISRWLTGRIAYYFYFLGLVLVVMLVIIKPAGATSFGVSAAITYSLLLGIPVIFHFYSLEKFFMKKKYPFYALMVIMIIGVFSTINYFLLRLIFHDKNVIWVFYIHSLVLLTITTALKFIKADIIHNLQAQKTETKRLEKVLVTLKSAIRPEVIMEKMSELHSLSVQGAEILPDKILESSEKMRESLKKPSIILNDSSEKLEEIKRELTWGNTKKYKIINSRLAWYFYFWGFLAFLFFIPWTSSQFQFSGRLYIFSYFVALSFPTYVHFFFLDRLLKRKYVYFPVVGILVVEFAYLYRYIFYTYFNYDIKLIQWTLMLIFSIIVTVAIRIVKDGLKKRMQTQEIKAWHLQSELNLLKSQVNPHFLFNTLNNLYSLSLDQSEKLPEMTRKLKDLMEYMLMSTNNEFVELSSEQEFLENYLSLEKLRFSEAADIRMTVAGNSKGKKIAPMLLIPFVENVFKHGISADVNRFFVHIDMKIERRYLSFSVVNSFPVNKPVNPVSKSGVGLKNVRRRLELLYPNAHNLLIEEKNDVYYVLLEIQL